MTKKQLINVAILAMVRSFPDQLSEGTAQGRLRGLYRKLQKETDRLLGKQPMVGKLDEKILEEKLTAWAMKTGWRGKGKHPVSVVVFLIGIVSDFIKDDTKLIAILQNIYDYFDRAGQVYNACLPAGTLASNRFSAIFEA